MKITIKAYDKARGEEGRKLLDKLTIDAQMVYWETEGSARLKYYGIECEKDPRGEYIVVSTYEDGKVEKMVYRSSYFDIEIKTPKKYDMFEEAYKNLMDRAVAAKRRFTETENKEEKGIALYELHTLRSEIAGMRKAFMTLFNKDIIYMDLWHNQELVRNNYFTEWRQD